MGTSSWCSREGGAMICPMTIPVVPSAAVVVGSASSCQRRRDEHHREERHSPRHPWTEEALWMAMMMMMTTIQRQPPLVSLRRVPISKSCRMNQTSVVVVVYQRRGEKTILGAPKVARREWCGDSLSRTKTTSTGHQGSSVCCCHHCRWWTAWVAERRKRKNCLLVARGPPRQSFLELLPAQQRIGRSTMRRWTRPPTTHVALC